MFAEDSDATLNLVAERAQVHRVTLYRHFPSREALIGALHNASLDDAEAAVLQADLEADDLLAEVEGLVRRIYEVNIKWRTHGWAPGYSSRTRERGRREHVGELTAALFATAQQRGLLRQDLDLPELLATWGGPIIYLTGNIADGHWTLDKAVSHTMRLLTPPPAAA